MLQIRFLFVFLGLSYCLEAININGKGCYIHPFHHCDEEIKEGYHIVHMGYETKCLIPIDPEIESFYVQKEINKFIPEPFSRGQPKVFPVGEHEDAFTFILSPEEVKLYQNEDDLEHNLWWFITGRYAKIRPSVICSDDFLRKQKLHIEELNPNFNLQLE